MPTQSPVRRSGRTRTKYVSIYEEGKKELEEREERKRVRDSLSTVGTGGSSKTQEESESEKESSDEEMEETPRRKRQTKKTTASTAKRKKTQEPSTEVQENEEDEEEEEVDEEPPEFESEEEENTSDEEDFITTTKSPKKKKPRSSVDTIATITPKRKPPKRAHQLGNRVGGAGAKRGKVRDAMLRVASKIIDKSELPQDNDDDEDGDEGNDKQQHNQKSLFANLLQSYRYAKSTAIVQDEEVTALMSKNRGGLLHSHNRRFVGTTDGNTAAPTETHPCQAARMQVVAQTLVHDHSRDPNMSKCQLLSFLFRSLGGSVERVLDPEGVRLDDLEDDAWVKLVTDLVNDMRHAKPADVLLCANPAGPGLGQPEMVAGEYRRIYAEFWELLALVALSDGTTAASNTTAKVVEDDEEDDNTSSSSKKRRATFDRPSSAIAAAGAGGIPTQFEAEMVREWIHLLTEFVSVGQPDVRAAATLAALHMGHGILDRTVVLREKLAVSQRQYDAASKSTPRSNTKKKRKKSDSGAAVVEGEKAASLRHAINSLQRSLQELEEMVTGPILKAIFMHRYRDSNEYIRAMCLSSLSRMTLQRPDLFLVDSYLKYFGWLMSDKVEVVRLEAICGLLAPFEANAGKRGTMMNGHVEAEPIDLERLVNVIDKFLNRLADCAYDVSPYVQEKALALLLHLVREGFLNEDSSGILDKVCLRSIAEDATHDVRRDALYFLMEHFESFEDEDEDGGDGGKKGGGLTERMAIQRVSDLASWLAHTLTDSEIPLDKIRVELADYFVFSLRDMPAHRSLVTRWSALLGAVKSDASATIDCTSLGDREDVAKQRVLVRMLACAARAEVGEMSDATFDDDGQFLVEGPEVKEKKKKGKARKPGMEHEQLSVALLRALPDLLTKFGGDSTTLISLTCLPRYMLPTAFSLAQRKKDFNSLVKSLVHIYMNSQEDKVLHNTATSLSYLARGDHARAADATLQLQKVVGNLKKRLTELAPQEKEGNEEDGEDGSLRRSSRLSMSPAAKKGVDETKDTEFSLSLILKRLRILACRRDLTEIVTGGADEVKEIVNLVARCLSERITNWKEYVSSSVVLSSISCAIEDGFAFLLYCSAWGLQALQLAEGLIVLDDTGATIEGQVGDKMFGDEQWDDPESNACLRMRNDLLDLLEQCIEHVPRDEEALTTDESFSDLPSDVSVGTVPKDGPAGLKQLVTFCQSIHSCAFLTSCDLRTLFPKCWTNAVHPGLQALALSDDKKLSYGTVQHLQIYSDDIRENQEQQEDEKDLTDPEHVLLPVARSLATNWPLVNLREAGLFLSHLAGTGQEATNVVTAVSRAFRKLNSTKLLEAHMACLRMAHNDWVDNEPLEISASEPTDEEMARYDEEERLFNEQFKSMETLAAKLARSLGVGRLADKNLSSAVARFLKEGVRVAFSASGEEELLPGSRLNFLDLVGKYAFWIRRNKTTVADLLHYLEEREEELLSDPNYGSVFHADDLKCLSDFRVALGLPPLPDETEQTQDKSDAEDGEEAEAEEEHDKVGEIVSPSTSVASSAEKRMNRSSITSARSRVSSAKSSVDLSPLYEREGSEEEESTIRTNVSHSSRSGATSQQAEDTTVGSRASTRTSVSPPQTPNTSSQRTAVTTKESRRSLATSRLSSLGSEADDVEDSQASHNSSVSPNSKSNRGNEVLMTDSQAATAPSLSPHSRSEASNTNAAETQRSQVSMNTSIDGATRTRSSLGDSSKGSSTERGEMEDSQVSTYASIDDGTTFRSTLGASSHDSISEGGRDSQSLVNDSQSLGNSQSMASMADSQTMDGRSSQAASVEASRDSVSAVSEGDTSESS